MSFVSASVKSEERDERVKNANGILYLLRQGCNVEYGQNSKPSSLSPRIKLAKNSQIMMSDVVRPKI